MSLRAVNGRSLSGGARIARKNGSCPAQHSIAPALHHSNPSLAVIVTCHAAYLPFLAETLASIDAQLPAPAERILCLDDCPADSCPLIPDSWVVIRGKWHNPNPARNAGWRATTAPWCVFWDGDDSMPPGYLAALLSTIDSRPSPGLGIVYPTSTRSDYETGQRCWNANTPDWSYWGQRQQLYIQSGAAWKRSALVQSGGWDDAAGVHDDGNLAARVTALGWQARRLAEPVVNLRSHSLGHRWQASDEQRAADLWRFRSLAIVLLIGRPHFVPSIAGKLATLDVPQRTSVVMVDNTPNGDAASLLPAWNLGRFEGLQIIRVAPYRGDTRRNCWERHQHISRLYNTAFAATNADLLFTWEDDVEIPDDAVRILWSHFLSGSKVGGAAGVYESAPDYHAGEAGWVCGSKALDRWRTDTRLADAPSAPEDWGFVHLGCSLWAGHALRQCLPHDPKPVQQWVEGGDAVMCRQMRGNGWRIILDGRVRCGHHWRES